MKNNEYNIVNITNEKSNFSAEYTNAQKVEYSFQSENKNPIKDELNDNSTVNDKVEDNLSKATREKEKKKEKQESEALESSSSFSSATSSGASSTAARSTAAASSAGSTGGALGGIVAAATVSVTAIGTIVGINVIGTQKSEPVTFLSSEVTTNSIDCSFSLPSNMLLSYEEPVESRKEVIVSVKNSDGFDYSEPVQYEEYDESTLIFYSYVDGLSAGTSYALTVQLEETTFVEQEPVTTYTDLAFRTFTTLSFVQKIVFNPLDVTYNSVSFSFEANLSDLGYNPDAPAMPNVFATIVDNDQFYDRLTLSNYEKIDDKRVTVFGDFSGLSPETTYTIDVYLDDETNLLGSATFTTLERTASVVFEEVEAGRDNVAFSFTVDKADIDYDPTHVPAVQYEVRSTDGAYYDSSWAESFVEVDDNTVRGSDSFSGLTPNTEYELEISLSTETEVISLGTTSFNTFHEFKFQKAPSVDVSPTSTNLTISIRASYIGYISKEETPDVINKLYISVVEADGGSPLTYQFESILEFGNYVSLPSRKIDNLAPNTNYVASVYYQPDNETPELLGSANFITSESPYGFELIYATPGENYCDFQFNLNSSEVQQNNISINIFYNKIQLTSITVTDWTQTSEDIMTASARVENLPSSATYSAEFYNNSTRTTYATKSFTTTAATGQYDFTIENQTIGKEDYSLDFSVNASAFSIDWTDGTAVDALQDQLLFEYHSADTTYQPEHAVGLMKSSDRASGNFSIAGLASDVEYVGIISYNDGTNNYPLCLVNFKTIPEVSGVNSNFAVVQDGSGNYRMPIDISFSGDSSYFGNNFIISFTPVGATSSFNATASVEEGYQYAIFEDGAVSSYFGSTLNYNVYCSNDLTTSLYEDTASLTDASTGRSNTIFSITDMTDELSSSNTNFNFSMICSLANKELSTTLVFVSGDDRYEYNIDLSNYDYSSTLSVDLLTTKSSTMTYEELKYLFNYVTFSIEIVYYANASTSQTTTCEITDSFTFNFID